MQSVYGDEQSVIIVRIPDLSQWSGGVTDAVNIFDNAFKAILSLAVQCDYTAISHANFPHHSLCGTWLQDTATSRALKFPKRHDLLLTSA